MKNLLERSSLLSAAFFFIAGMIALQIPFTQLMGSSVKFTAFDFFAPVVGAFMGTIPGILTVLLTELVHTSLHGGITDIGGFIRLIPILFAVWYFAKPRSTNLFVAAVAILAFNLNPIGRSAWQFSLFWLIPIAAHFYQKNAFVRAMGATFTAHAVGGALWVWTVGLSKTLWLALIPQVAVERLAMSAGIVLSFALLTAAATALRSNKQVASVS